MSCTLATKTADLFVLISNPFFFKNEPEATEAIVFENRRSSSLPAAGDVSQGRTSATQHTDDVKSVCNPIIGTVSKILVPVTLFLFFF